MFEIKETALPCLKSIQHSLLITWNYYFKINTVMFSQINPKCNILPSNKILLKFKLKKKQNKNNYYRREIIYFSL